MRIIDVVVNGVKMNYEVVSVHELESIIEKMDVETAIRFERMGTIPDDDEEMNVAIGTERWNTDCRLDAIDMTGATRFGKDLKTLEKLLKFSSCGTVWLFFGAGKDYKYVIF